MKKCFQSIYTFVQDSDKFSIPLQFTYQKKDRFTTFIGGIVSIIIFAITMYMMISKLIEVFELTEMKTITNILYRDFAKENHTISINPRDFNIAIRWITRGGEVVPPDIGTISVWNYGTPSLLNQRYVTLYNFANKLELFPCDEYNFSEDRELLAQLKDYRCISNSTNFTLAGDEYSKDHRYLQFWLES